MRSWVPALWIAPWLACASFDGGGARVPLCGSLASLPPLATAHCEDRELAQFQDWLVALVVPPAGQALVRVELDEAARVSSVCVDEGKGNVAWGARYRVAEQLDAMRALPAGPACAAGKRLDVNRYEAKWAEANELRNRCAGQSGQLHEAAAQVAERQYERCVEHEADSILLAAPGSTRPVIFAKPEIPEPPGPQASDTVSRCSRKAFPFEEQVACIEADGWERLYPSR